MCQAPTSTHNLPTRTGVCNWSQHRGRLPMQVSQSGHRNPSGPQHTFVCTCCCASEFGHNRCQACPCHHEPKAKLHISIAAQAPTTVATFITRTCELHRPRKRQATTWACCALAQQEPNKEPQAVDCTIRTGWYGPARAESESAYIPQMIATASWAPNLFTYCKIRSIANRALSRPLYTCFMP